MPFEDDLAVPCLDQEAVGRMALDILKKIGRLGARLETGLALAAFPAQAPAPLPIDIDPEQRPAGDGGIIIRHRPLKSGNRDDLSDNLAAHGNIRAPSRCNRLPKT